eukprot:scaffold2727_cov140-Isochrysis_galbana.AAC.2
MKPWVAEFLGERLVRGRARGCWRQKEGAHDSLCLLFKWHQGVFSVVLVPPQATLQRVDQIGRQNAWHVRVRAREVERAQPLQAGK